MVHIKKILKKKRNDATNKKRENEGIKTRTRVNLRLTLHVITGRQIVLFSLKENSEEKSVLSRNLGLLWCHVSSLLQRRSKMRRKPERESWRTPRTQQEPGGGGCEGDTEKEAERQEESQDNEEARSQGEVVHGKVPNGEEGDLMTLVMEETGGLVLEKGRNKNREGSYTVRCMSGRWRGRQKASLGATPPGGCVGTEKEGSHQRMKVWGSRRGRGQPVPVATSLPLQVFSAWAMGLTH